MTEGSREFEAPSPTDASRAAERLSREQLYELVWREPMLRVGERFGVSSSYLARVCTELRVPRPPRGFWAQLEFGKAPAQEPLPDARKLPAHQRRHAARERPSARGAGRDIL